MAKKTFVAGSVLRAADVNEYLTDSRNVLINGDFDIWQRGTSFTPTNGSFNADRWSTTFDGSGSTRTISQQTFTPGTEIGVGSPYFLRYAQSVAGSGGNYSVLNNRIEDVRTFAGQSITVSFYAKASATVTMPAMAIDQNFGSGGSSDVRTSVGSANTLTTSWARYSATVTLPAITGKTVGTSSFLQLEMYFPVNTTFTIDIFGVQVEEGTVATPFHRNANSIQGELAACQRYYYRVDTANATSNYLRTIMGFCSSTTISAQLPLPTEMRSAPTSLESSGANTWSIFQNNTTYAITGAFTLSQASPNYVMIAGAATGQTSGAIATLEARNTKTAYFAVSAEL